MCQTRFSNSPSGNSKASAWTSWGSARHTAPVSAWSVSTRVPSSSAPASCSGRFTRFQYFDTGRKESFTVVSPSQGSSSCWSTGWGARVANTSPGRSSTGSRLTVASAAPVTMLVAPGPIDVVHASVDRRLRIRAKPEAACTIACSLRAWW